MPREIFHTARGSVNDRPFGLRSRDTEPSEEAPIPYEAELGLAHELADLADDISMRLFRGTFEVRLKPDQSPVTEADESIEAALRERLSRVFPADAVLGEEGGPGGAASSSRTWIIDPIDGTKNFTHGIQIWGTLIALAVNGVPVVGVASAPALGERYHAARGGGAAMNGKTIRVSRESDLSRATLCSSGLYTFQRSGGHWERPYGELVREVARNRSFGDFWGHMLVARGSVEAMAEPALRIWDWAALQVIVEEAGGRVTQLDGSTPADGGAVLSTNGHLHDELLARFATVA